MLEEYQKFLEKDLLPRAKGEWRLGKEKFAAKLELELDAGLTADEVLREAEAEFDRVEREMYVDRPAAVEPACSPARRCRPTTRDGQRETIRLVLAKFNQEHGKAEDLVQATPRPAWSRSRRSFATRTSCGCRSRTAARSSRCRSSSAAIPSPT